jgi:hypothetical protein
MLGTMGAAKNHSSLFHTMPDHSATTVFTSRRQRIDGAFERIKHMLLPVQCHRESLVVFIATHFAFGHGKPPLEGKSVSRTIKLKGAKKMPDGGWIICRSRAYVESLAHGLHLDFQPNSRNLHERMPENPAGLLTANVNPTRKDKPSWEQFCSSS